MQGKSHRAGLYQCNACREPFTVTVGTLYERSHIPLNKWLAATHLMMASKKGMSALQVGRMLGLSKKTAWFLCHRIRESLRETKLDTPLGGQNKVVEADETYVGGKAANRKGKVPPKEAAFALVKRDGFVRSFHVAAVDAATLRPILRAHVDRHSYLMTDSAPTYIPMGRDFVGHGAVNHSIEEYVRGTFWHTNTIENYFSILKRGIVGTFHHISQQHLKRYLAEFDYRYNQRQGLGINDAERMARSIGGIVGKRLTYRRTGGREDAEEAIPF
jgi:transposase-like protein